MHSPTGPDTHDIIKLEENGPLKHEDSDSVTVPDEDGFSVHSSGLDSADSDDETDLSEEMYPYYDTYVYIYEILFVSELEKITAALNIHHYIILMVNSSNIVQLLCVK